MVTYFAPVQKTIINPMHNLYIGSVKHFVSKYFMSHSLETINCIIVIFKRIPSLRMHQN